MEKSLLVALVATLTILTTGYVILASNDRDTSSYAIFLGGPLVSAIVGAILAQRSARVEAVVQQVKHQTDGLLTARLDSVDRQLSAAHVDRTDIAAAGGQPQTADGPSP